MKRLFDFLLATFGILAFFPVGLAAAIAVKLGDGGPVFYTQPRWGRNGRKFRAVKFRSMIHVPEADAEFKPAEEHDARITTVGRFLRNTALDELPQLLNIWRGDMSFVGPRALAVQEIGPHTPGFEERHRVRPGLTGPAQLYAAKDIPLTEKFRYDVDYAATRSFPGDLKLLFMSVWVTLRGKWETRDAKF